MTDIESLGESVRLATGTPMPDGTVTNFFEGLELAP